MKHLKNVHNNTDITNHDTIICENRNEYGENCGKLFCQEEKKNYHIKIVHGNTETKTEKVTIKCNICDKIFVNSGKLSIHMTKFHGDNNQNNMIKCLSCLKEFPKKSIRNHIRNSKSCSARYDISELQKLNHEIDKDKKNFNCEHCGKKLSCKQRLVNHIRNFHEEKKDFICKYCKIYVCSRECDMVRHIDKFHNNKKNKNNSEYNKCWWRISFYLSRS